MNTTLVLIDYAAIAVIVYIALTVLSRAALLAAWTYIVRDYIKSEKSSAKPSLGSEHNSPPTYDW